MARFIFPLLSLATFALGTAAFGNSDWTISARRLTGESGQVRVEAINKLRATPGIDEILRKELEGSDRFLAYDVISALKLKSHLQELIVVSEKDDSGFAYLAINTLADSSNLKELKRIYADRLKRGKGTPAVKIVLLDTLSRMQVRVPPEDLAEYLFQESSPEVRQAALYYLRSRLLSFHDMEMIPLFRRTLEEKVSPTFRIQALFTAAELPATMFSVFKHMRAECPQDSPEELHDVCERIKRERNSR